MIQTRFGHIGITIGPKDNARKVLEVIGRAEGGIYAAENMAKGVEDEHSRSFVYVTGEHLQDLKGATPSFKTLIKKFSVEFHDIVGDSRGFAGEEMSVGQCRSGKGAIRTHRVFHLSA